CYGAGEAADSYVGRTAQTAPAPALSAWSDRSLIVGLVPDSGHFGLRVSGTSRNRIVTASYVRSRPTSRLPQPSRNLIASVASISPITPGSTPRTPTCPQDGTMCAGGGVRWRQR